MVRHHRRRLPELAPLTGEQQRRLDAWLAELDHPGQRLEAAQRVLRLAPAEWPAPPGDPAPAPVPTRRGAYARRRAAGTG